MEDIEDIHFIYGIYRGYPISTMENIEERYNFLNISQWIAWRENIFFVSVLKIAIV